MCLLRGMDSNHRSSDNESDELTTSLPRNIYFLFSFFTVYILYNKIFKKSNFFATGAENFLSRIC